MERFRTADSNSLNELLAIIDFHRETDLSVSWRDGLEKVLVKLIGPLQGDPSAVETGLG